MGPTHFPSVNGQARDDRLSMLCHEWAAEHCLSKCQVQEGGEAGIHVKEGYEWILLVENTCTASKMISTLDIVPFSLPKYENTCILIKHLRNIISVWWVCQLRKDIREICKSLGSGKHLPSRFRVRVWNLFASVYSYVCIMETGNRNQEILILSLQRPRSSWLLNKWEKWKMML